MRGYRRSQHILNDLTMSVLVTTGGTVPFKRLLSLVLSSDFLRFLDHTNITSLLVQYGNGQDAFSYVKSLLSELGINPIPQPDNNKTTNRNGEFDIHFLNIHIQLFSYVNDLSLEMKNVDLIISHAGKYSL